MYVTSSLLNKEAKDLIYIEKSKDKAAQLLYKYQTYFPL